MSRLHRPRSQEALGEPAQSTCLRDFLPEERGLRPFRSTLLRSVVGVAPRRAVWANGVASCYKSNLSKEMPLWQVGRGC